MQKRPNIAPRELDQIWNDTPLPDRRFIATMISINEGLELKGVRFKPLPQDLQRRLKRSDQVTLFSILTECVGLLSGSKVMQRVKADIASARRRHVRPGRPRRRDFPRRKSRRT